MVSKIIQLSPNSLNLFLECPHCFWLDKNLGIKRPPPYPYALNSAVDELLKEEFDSYRAKKLPHPLLKDNNIKAHLFENQKLLNQWRNNLAGIRYFDSELEATLFGAVDDVLEFDDPPSHKATEGQSKKIYKLVANYLISDALGLLEGKEFMETEFKNNSLFIFC